MIEMQAPRPTLLCMCTGIRLMQSMKSPTEQGQPLTATQSDLVRTWGPVTYTEHALLALTACPRFQVRGYVV